MAAIFSIENPAIDGETDSYINVDDDGETLTIRIDDIFGDNAVISLAEPQRSEFIKRIKELNHG